MRLTRQVRDFTIVHATLDTPSEWGYVFNNLDAVASFTYQHTAVCFFGHTHVAGAFVRDDGVKRVKTEQLPIEPGKKYFINTGSVGQPRDGDPRAAYCIYDAENERGRAAPRPIRHAEDAAQNHRGRTAALARRPARARPLKQPAANPDRSVLSSKRSRAIRAALKALPPMSYNSILIIKPSSLGDIVHTLPAVAAIREANPDAKITWVINPEWAPLLRGNRDIDHVQFSTGRIPRPRRAGQPAAMAEENPRPAAGRRRSISRGCCAAR